MNMTNDQIAAALAHPGAIGVVASDTVYGIMARAADHQAVQRMYDLKRREHKPGTLIAASTDQLVALGLKQRYLTPVAKFWPGAVSVVIPCADDALAYLHQGVQSLAVRIPADKRLLDLLGQTGPLITSSANQPGEPPANTIAEAKAYFGDAVDFYADAGDLSGRAPSTVVRVVDDVLEVLRQGAVHINERGEIEP
ncbi:MAG TPA: L-threonylcarbamoyladenylate synthase [Candidatus Saccharimonadales bacterium]|nr:L-threonylcarbamoyladenylate synthase [Candidatus Saccharimonadales bacterium]